MCETGNAPANPATIRAAAHTGDGSSRRRLKDFTTRVVLECDAYEQTRGGDMNVIKRNPYSIPRRHQAGPNITLPAPSHHA